MPQENLRNPHIIGLTGSFGSGCTYVADEVLVPAGYRKTSLSDVLKQLFRDKTRKSIDGVPRSDLQDFGDELRKTQPDFLAQKCIEDIKADESKDKATKWVVDSIRNPAEIRALRDASRNFFLLGLYADKEQRWERVHSRYNSDRNAFETDDKRDRGGDHIGHGQRVSDCFSEADIVLTNQTHFDVVGNDTFEGFKRNILYYADLTANPLKQKQAIRSVEALMAMAYATSQQSSCMRRKVGAVIVDSDDNVISSGYNEVPKNERPCERKYRDCYRNVLRTKFFGRLVERGLAVAGKESELRCLFEGEFKILDCCRALHAEENAIINLARNGRSVPLDQCVLYTTTYPCRLCANKIINIGIKRLVYLEPYPDEDSRAILEGNVENEFFQGITFRAYFRIYGEEKK